MRILKGYGDTESISLLASQRNIIRGLLDAFGVDTGAKSKNKEKTGEPKYSMCFFTEYCRSQYLILAI